MHTGSTILRRMKTDAADIFSEAVKAVEPGLAVKKNCALNGHFLFLGNRSFDIDLLDHIYIVGAGKAAAPMASALEDLLGAKLSGGVISVKYGHGQPLRRITMIEAGHPVPDENSRAAAMEVLRLARSAGKNDLVICLISGGGSALLSLPVSGISFSDKQKTIQALLTCGATIHEINAIRKHISGIKGGRLGLAAFPAPVVSLILSDVVGDDLDVIASGPTVPDAGTFTECLNIVEKYHLQSDLPKSIFFLLTNGAKGKIPETPKPGEPCFNASDHVLVGNNFQALATAQKRAVALGYHTLMLSTMMEGEAAQAAKMHAAIAKELLKTGNPVPCPACILSGGESTVVVKGTGKGGRNMEFALAFAVEIAGFENAVLLSAGTDGTDGPTDAAGAMADTDTFYNALGKGLSPIKSLNNNDSYHFFKAMGDLFITGPTRTNVMDIRIMLVNPPDFIIEPSDRF